MYKKFISPALRAGDKHNRQLWIIILIIYLKYFTEVYEVAVLIKMLYMTFSPSNSCGNPVQKVYTLQLSWKITNHYLCSSKKVRNYLLIFNYLLILKYFPKVYELAVCIKMLHMTFSSSHSCGNLVQQAYTHQQSCKFTYNFLYRY